MVDQRLYYIRIGIIGCIAGMHLAVMDMFKVAFKTFLEELGMITGGDSTDVVLDEYSKIYSLSALLDIPMTLFWGYFTDRYGTKLSLNIQGFGTVMIFVMLSMTNSYGMFFFLMVFSTVFDKYIVALDTFFSWVPESKKITYIRAIQLVKSLMMQSGPILGGLLTSLKLTEGITHVAFYHRILAAVMTTLLLAFNVAFIQEGSTVSKPADEDDKWKQIRCKQETERIVRNTGDQLDEEVAERRVEIVKDGGDLADTDVNYQAVKIGPPANEREIEKLGILKNFLYIWNHREARYLILLGLYLRMAKKYVDYGFHLWAEIKREENGLGLNKFALGTCSSLGGITSVAVYFLLFTDLEINDLPRIIKRSFILISATVFCFPFLIYFRGFLLDVAVYLIILSFMINEALLFSGWIGLLNTCLPKSIRARSYSLALTIKGCIGFFCSYLLFAGFRWSLNCKAISAVIGPLNSAMFFWLFAAASLAVYSSYRHMTVTKLEGQGYSLTV